ncbi:FAD:protein FMN transferase [[Pseudomonas] carboxydohydrogena]|uniref:FAD:protein FMN transferase n=1 Tax=Afipia carboxydohydrogena TaxID=290 RepID=A0ABY8BMV5_AFICR|nr:FAD:protein FMN transferase [[Pseudomonas] carboxydohydrogena]WEF51307.1 FAD:protein FMN transferase [[Pseudomonas] carboxydohydrogena]
MTTSLPRRVAIPPLSAMPRAAPAGASVQELSGTTMGTTWSVKFAGSAAARQTLGRMIPAALERVVSQMSPWESNSDISRFNRLPMNEWQTLPPELFKVMEGALRIAQESDGAYDPTLGALIDLWGFGPSGPRTGPPAASDIAPHHRACGWQQIDLDAGRRRMRRSSEGAIDLCGIAKGYAVDLVMETLHQHGLYHALVEIGGELRGSGVKPDGSPWWVEIDRSADGKQPVLVALYNLAIATSGCERGFTSGAQHFSHTLNPRTGWPTANGTVTATVLHSTCMEADAYATALMVLGQDDAIDFAITHRLAAAILCKHGDTFIERTTPMLDQMLS